MNDIIVEKKEDIGRLLDFLHDRPLSLEDINFDEAEKELSFYVDIVTDEIVDLKKSLLGSTWKNPVCASRFYICNVDSYKIVDDAEIGCAIVNTISYQNNNVEIKCSVPVKISAKVSKLYLKLSVGDKVVETVSRFGKPPLEDIGGSS
jgi:hypothetical protein